MDDYRWHQSLWNRNIQFLIKFYPYKNHPWIDDKNHPILDDFEIIQYWMFKNTQYWMIIDDISLSIEKNTIIIQIWMIIKLGARRIQMWMVFYWLFSSIFGLGTYLESDNFTEHYIISLPSACEFVLLTLVDCMLRMLQALVHNVTANR